MAFYATDSNCAERIFFWTHFRLSLWKTTHLRMRHATLSAQEPGNEASVEHDRAKRLPDCCYIKTYSSGEFKQQGTSAYNYNVLSVSCEQDWKVIVSEARESGPRD